MASILKFSDFMVVIQQSKCYGQEQNITWRRWYELDKYTTEQWIRIKWFCYLNKMLCKLSMKWIKNTK
jgi:hypothetical protein